MAIGVEHSGPGLQSEITHLVRTQVSKTHYTMFFLYMLFFKPATRKVLNIFVMNSAPNSFHEPLPGRWRSFIEIIKQTSVQLECSVIAFYWKVVFNFNFISFTMFYNIINCRVCCINHINTTSSIRKSASLHHYSRVLRISIPLPSTMPC